MSGTQIYHLALSVGFSISLVTLIAVLLSSRTNSTHFYMSNTEHLDPKIVKVVNLIGGDLLSILPKNVQKKSISDKEINDVFKASGNPWGVTKLEFLALRVSYGFIASIIGFLFVMLVRPGFILGTLIVLALTFLGWNKPLSEYKKIAQDKERDFKKHFPEMLDYLTMIMSDGTYTFANAIEVVLPYLPDSAVKSEFTKVVDSINSGMTTEEALIELSGRLPSPALEAFINAVNNANTLNTPMDGLMRTRAKKSREDLTNELELLIQGLPTKTMLTVAPATILSMLLIFMVPVIVALMSSL
jgi:Flp pilus assembly protein TadB